MRPTGSEGLRDCLSEPQAEFLSEGESPGAADGRAISDKDEGQGAARAKCKGFFLFFVLGGLEDTFFFFKNQPKRLPKTSPNRNRDSLQTYLTCRGGITSIKRSGHYFFFSLSLSLFLIAPSVFIR